MCGIVGSISSKNISEEHIRNFYHQLIIEDQTLMDLKNSTKQN